MNILFCVERPQALLLSDVFALTERKVGDDVSIRMANETWEFLAYGVIVAVRKAGEHWRYDAKVITK